MSDNKFVSGGLLFTAVSFFTYQLMSNNTKPKQKHTRPYRPNIASILEETSMETSILESHPIPTPNNTPEYLVKDPDITLPNLDIYDEINSPLVPLESSEISQIVENIENLGEKRDTNSMSSFLELFNTGSQTDTEELEFTKINNSKADQVESILRNIINDVTNKNVYGSAGESAKSISLNNETHSETTSDILNISYHSDGEILPIRRRKKVNRILKFYKRSKSN